MCTLAVWKFIESFEKDVCFKHSNSSSSDGDLTRYSCENGKLTFIGKLPADYPPYDEGYGGDPYIFKTWTSKSDDLRCSQWGTWEAGDWKSPKFSKRPRTMISYFPFPFHKK